MKENFVKKSHTRKIRTGVATPRLAVKGGRRRFALKSKGPEQTAQIIELKEPSVAIVPRDEAQLAADYEKAPERLPYDGNTAFNLYLREVGQTKLLTIEEENQLAARIKKGDKKARELMIKANLRLVVKIAREYEDYGMPLLDLINEGNIGLMKAVERFDPTKGAKLSTYSAWWIKQAIKRALANQSKTIRLPVHVVDKLFHMRRSAMKLQEVLGREPTDEELGDELGFSAQKVAQLRTAAIRPASLEAPLGDDDTSRISDVVADESADTPYEQLEDKTNTSMLRELVATLEQREAEILRYRFGLDGDAERTLEEVGQKFGVTRERIRQIQNTALAKLRKQIEKLETVRVAA
jgi:RNA polymerase primary sigma factor